ncbi:signal transducing adapter molecule 1-like isoform X2 [Dreissena polymorpha]|nr:signal transducing adapter molecule 1-like isoform X2 [Dreissena polymorpha]
MKEFKEDSALMLIPQLYESMKKEGVDCSNPDSAVKQPVTLSKDPNVAQSQQEEDDLAKAIALSLQEDKHSTQHKTSAGLYPMTFGGGASSGATASPRVREVRKVRALYDFEAVEDNELTFKAGELISVLDDSDPNWWKGFNQRGEGLFPANFVTADLTVEPEEPKKKVDFKEEVEVKSFEPDQVEIDEEKIDHVLQLIQNADPTGETNPDSSEMVQLEEQCKVMGPLIDAELEKIDRKHADLCGINTKVLEALQMYHSLMKETPLPFKYTTYSSPAMGMTPGPPGPSAQHFNGSIYMPQGGQMMPGQMPPMTQGQMPPMTQGQMPPMSQVQMPPMSQGQMPQMSQGQMPLMSQGSGMSHGHVQTYTSPSSQNYNNNAPSAGQPPYNTAPQQPHLPQNIVPSQQNINTPVNMRMAPSSTQQYMPQSGPVPNMDYSGAPQGLRDYTGGAQGVHAMYQQAIPQQHLL